MRKVSSLIVQKKVSIIIPVYNEETCIHELWRRFLCLRESLKKYDFEYIFVNDGSTDRTYEILRTLATENRSVRVISFARNFGHEAAISAGCVYAKGEAVVFIDADLQDPPDLIPLMLEKYEEGFDVVYGVRKSREGENLFKKKTAQWFYRILNSLSYIKIPTDTSNFRLISRRVLEVFNSLPERDRFIRGMVSWIGFRQTGIYFNRESRYAGETKYTFKKMFAFALDGIIGFSNLPLHLSLWMGIGLGVFALLLIVILFFADSFFGISREGLLIIASIVFVGGLNMLVLGILGEYIARIHNEAKARPLYVIAERLNID